MREAIAQYVEREEKRERLRQDAVVAWTHYPGTGLYVTAGEADAYHYDRKRVVILPVRHGREAGYSS